MPGPVLLYGAGHSFFTVILGCLPLALSTGAGSVSRSEMGTTVVFGMLTATVLGIFMIPMLFVAIESIGNDSKKSKE